MLVYLVQLWGDLDSAAKEEVERCMRELVVVWILCAAVRDSRGGVRWDFVLVIRSRGRWGKCGWLLLDIFVAVITEFIICFITIYQLLRANWNSPRNGFWLWQFRISVNKSYRMQQDHRKKVILIIALALLLSFFYFRMLSWLLLLNFDCTRDSNWTLIALYVLYWVKIDWKRVSLFFDFTLSFPWISFLLISVSIN